MCGLFGVVQRVPISEPCIKRARAARDTLWYRGPDDSGEYVMPNLYMGHRRLSILDTSDAGRQPMVAGDVAVTVNGEIYNFLALRGELERAGYRFRSHSDSEVVLHGYRHWGVDGLVERLDGMYACAIYDNSTQRLYLFRDRVGIKPLYFYLDKDKLLWASEIKAIESYISSSLLKTNNEALLDFLVYRYVPAPKSIYKDVHKLTAASILEFNLGRFSKKHYRYWKLIAHEDPLTPRKQASKQQELLSLLEKSVYEQLVSDVPLGVLLSGGIDSSAVTAIASKRVSSMKSFSLGFSGSARDETPHAEKMARYAKTEHSVQHFSDADVEDPIEFMCNMFDEPFGDLSCLPTYAVCVLARKSVKVVLSGDGGDEVFGGYRRYERFAFARKYGRLVPFRLLEGIDFPRWLPHADKLRWLSISDPIQLYAFLCGSPSVREIEKWKRILELPVDYDPLWAFKGHYDSTLTPRKQAQVLDFYTYLPDNVLTKVDRTSMALSLECRPPILSKDLIEYAFTLPETFLYKDYRLKGGLKDSISGILPREILERRKQGFGLPIGLWRKDIEMRYGGVKQAIVSRYLKNS